MKLLELYKSILAVANLRAGAEGHISVVFGEESKPAVIKGKRLVLPTQEQMIAIGKKECVAFHPLSENILHGASEVLTYFRHALNVRLNYTFGLLAYELLTLATSPGQHAKLSPDQSEFLSKIKNADEKTLVALQKLMAAMPSDQTQQAFCSIFLKRTGTVGDKRYSRVGVVSFPLYEELSKGSQEIYGVKLRVKDRDSLVELLEYMVPCIKDPESHNRGSNSTVAPFLDALMQAVLVVASPLNDQVELFRNYLDSPEELEFENEWVPVFDNLSVMQDEIRRVPMLPGNDGAELKAATPAPANSSPAAATPTAPAPAMWSPPTNQAPYQAPPPQYTPHYQQPYQPPQPRVTERGQLDFASILQSNPALASQVGPAFQPQQMQNPANSPPRWAAPQQQSLYAPMQLPNSGYQLNGQPTWGGGTVGFGRL